MNRLYITRMRWGGYAFDWSHCKASVVVSYPHLTVRFVDNNITHLRLIHQPRIIRYQFTYILSKYVVSIILRTLEPPWEWGWESVYDIVLGYALISDLLLFTIDITTFVYENNSEKCRANKLVNVQLFFSAPFLLRRWISDELKLNICNPFAINS